MNSKGKVRLKCLLCYTLFNILKGGLFSDSVITMILQDQQQLIQSLIRCQKKFYCEEMVPCLRNAVTFLGFAWIIIPCNCM